VRGRRLVRLARLEGSWGGGHGECGGTEVPVKMREIWWRIGNASKLGGSCPGAEPLGRYSFPKRGYAMASVRAEIGGGQAIGRTRAGLTDEMGAGALF